MQSRRKLKKNIHQVCDDLFSECCILFALIPSIDEKKVEKVLAEIIALEKEFIEKIGFKGEAATVPSKSYYAKLKSDWEKALLKISDEIGAITK